MRLRFSRDAAGVTLDVNVDPKHFEQELEELRRAAFEDELTGLPNAQALENALERHQRTMPLSVVVIDFDGLKGANEVYGYELGGDVLIGAVGHGLSTLINRGEYAARMHTAGDEFAVLLPEVAEDAARVRAREIELGLDSLDVPQTHREIYGGASVGVASRQFGETPGQVLGRAIEVMRARKRERKKAKH